MDLILRSTIRTVSMRLAISESLQEELIEITITSQDMELRSAEASTYVLASMHSETIQTKS
jgi:hypothetical protein